MPTALTYPGVYVEEVPSGVHTITGVATSIAAFVGFTPRGPVNQPIHIFSFADYERAFGGLSVDSVVSYCVKHFFDNGGTEAYVVRVARNATQASVTLQDIEAAPQPSLTIQALSPGVWGNGLQIDIDYATTNPSDLFNLTVSEYAVQGGVQALVTSEVYRNLSMYRNAPTAVEQVVNAGSQLIEVTNHAPLPPPGPGLAAGGFSVSGTIANITTALSATQNRISVGVDGDGPWDIDITPGLSGVNTAADIANKINAVAGGGRVNVLWTGGANKTLTITSTDLAGASSVHVYNASENNAADILNFGLANGGVEQSGWATYRPVQTGTVAAAPSTALTAGALGFVQIDVYSATGGAPIEQIDDVELLDPASPPTSLAELATTMNAALRHASMAHPRLVGATAEVVGGQFRVALGPGDPNASMLFANTGGGDTTATDLGLAAATRNVTRYAPGTGVTVLAQVQGVVGNDGIAPLAADLTGDEAAKTGIYALANVDIFNLLVMPDVYGQESAANYGVLDEAIAYCERRRAMMIIDAPSSVKTFADAQTWITGSNAGSLRSRNAALYFPRIQEPDPLQGVVNPFPAAGAIAGVYARTDSERGIWKAPAGTDAMVAGATGLTYTMTDGENGTLNPLGLNALRTFPVIGTVVFGARTGRGADVLADDYKYVPVRRLALFLEESLYRGTQWAVFEPNDEPLWAQIRLNLGAFMHGLYAQGAFEGSTPREAYFVKCDSTTTTQNDIDLGRVNIVVGFAPLKPAEFVVIRIQQIAGAIQT